MKKATSIIIPDEILDFILNAFNKKEVRSHKPNGNSFVHDLTKAMNNFIHTNNEQFSFLRGKFPYGISEDIIKRAFNYKSPPGATKHLRNAFALYATDCKYNWNDLITFNFPHHSPLLNKHEDTCTKHLHNATLNEICEKLNISIQLQKEILQKLSKRN
jgi:hypothetical protein